ncbi:hypothetical protein C8J56DRAFT_1080892 [Mycena floridula]|nr:hypothetical protein C8J56DRAFT_1080892 [Mycena floridula]
MSAPFEMPTFATILVIGGGPAGSYAASALQREGHQVVLFESSKFPRYHVGESMLPSFRNYMHFIDLEDQVVNHGFIPKPGATFKLDHSMDSTWTDFTTYGDGYRSYNVIRSELDDMMLRHAEKQGVRVYEETRADSIEFGGTPGSSRPVAANWTNKMGETGRISFEWLVDASGRSGLMSTKYLKNRQMRESLRNVAVWAYWKDVTLHGKGTKQEGSGWFEALTDQTGWGWVIPLNDGTTSIGIVMHQDISNTKKTALNANGQKMSLTEHYLDQLQFVPGVKELIGEAGNMISGTTKSAADYSYFAATYSGDHFRVIGDAANFVDPFFSSGVHIAMTGGLSAALTICASMKGQVDEETAQGWHDLRVGIAHTRFLFVVLGAYQQMHLQTTPILTNDVNATNFDKAFEMFRPVIYGIADSTNQLTDEAVKNMMDTFSSFFDPDVDHKHVSAVSQRYGEEFVRIDGDILGQTTIESMTKGNSHDKKVLSKFDAVRVFKDEIKATNMGRTPLLGYSARIERGSLGLSKDY